MLVKNGSFPGVFELIARKHVRFGSSTLHARTHSSSHAGLRAYVLSGGLRERRGEGRKREKQRFPQRHMRTRAMAKMAKTGWERVARRYPSPPHFPHPSPGAARCRQGRARDAQHCPCPPRCQRGGRIAPRRPTVAGTYPLILKYPRPGLSCQHGSPTRARKSRTPATGRLIPYQVLHPGAVALDFAHERQQRHRPED